MYLCAYVLNKSCAAAPRVAASYLLHPLHNTGIKRSKSFKKMADGISEKLHKRWVNG